MVARHAWDGEDRRGMARGWHVRVLNRQADSRTRTTTQASGEEEEEASPPPRTHTHNGAPMGGLRLRETKPTAPTTTTTKLLAAEVIHRSH